MKHCYQQDSCMNNTNVDKWILSFYSSIDVVLIFIISTLEEKSLFLSFILSQFLDHDKSEVKPQSLGILHWLKGRLSNLDYKNLVCPQMEELSLLKLNILHKLWNFSLWWIIIMPQHANISFVLYK